MLETNCNIIIDAVFPAKLPTPGMDYIYMDALASGWGKRNDSKKNKHLFLQYKIIFLLCNVMLKLDVNFQ